jgi:hypothetical protein
MQRARRPTCLTAAELAPGTGAHSRASPARIGPDWGALAQGCDGARVGGGEVVGEDEAALGGLAAVEVRRGQAEYRGGPARSIRLERSGSSVRRTRDHPCQGALAYESNSNARVCDVRAPSLATVKSQENYYYLARPSATATTDVTANASTAI